MIYLGYLSMGWLLVSKQVNSHITTVKHTFKLSAAQNVATSKIFNFSPVVCPQWKAMWTNVVSRNFRERANIRASSLVMFKLSDPRTFL